MNLDWYINRMRRMGPWEIAVRVRDEAAHAGWRVRKGRQFSVKRIEEGGVRELPFEAAASLDDAARTRVIAEAEEIAAGRLFVLGRMVGVPQSAPDWFRDPETRILTPMSDYAFDIDMRDPAVVGNHKFLLEPARLQHLTVLGAAWRLTGREEFAKLAASQLHSWGEANPFLTGVHWTSGIEIGLRLINIAYCRRLLGNWPGVSEAFDLSPLVRQMIYQHLRYLEEFRSHGSSANNHLLAELVGLYVGAGTFGWFAECPGWARSAATALESAAERQVFSDGMYREQASEYHGFALELFLLAAIEAQSGGTPLGKGYYEIVARMADAWAAALDVALRPPRQGDSDDAFALVLDGSRREARPQSLLAAAKTVIGAAPWWPAVPEDFRSKAFAAVMANGPSRLVADRPARRPAMFAHAGAVFLRDIEPRTDEIWCRCDHGPLGLPSLAAHGHADALSIEVRHGGVDILADPGTYCYLTEQGMRRYFKSTIAHNTLEIGGQDSARYGGPFLWLNQPKSCVISVCGLDGGDVADWTASHAGYVGQKGAPVHERSVTLDRARRSLRVCDVVHASAPVNVRLAFHIGPEVAVEGSAGDVALAWSVSGAPFAGRLRLPGMLEWKSCRASLDPPAGWYSPRFGERVPCTTFIGEGTIDPDVPLETTLSFE